MNRVLFKSTHDNWKTPIDVYRTLDAEFGFRDDPCPLGGSGGLDRMWGSPFFMNPPFSEIGKWIKKAHNESMDGKTGVLLIPSRTDTRWWHDYVMTAKEIRFIKGRLRFGDAKHNAPFPSCIVILGGEK